jgi:hypothetical protein
MNHDTQNTPATDLAPRNDKPDASFDNASAATPNSATPTPPLMSPAIPAPFPNINSEQLASAMAAIIALRDAGLLQTLVSPPISTAPAPINVTPNANPAIAPIVTPSAATPKQPTATIPIFKGKSSENGPAWLSLVCMIKRNSRWTDETAFSMVISRLEENALHWLHTVRTALESDAQPWTRFQELFAMRYANPIHLEQARAKLVALWQHDRESVHDYTNRFSELRHLVPDIGEAMMIWHYLNGLTPKNRPPLNKLTPLLSE